MCFQLTVLRGSDINFQDDNHQQFSKCNSSWKNVQKCMTSFGAIQIIRDTEGEKFCLKVRVGFKI
jgi:hypothetical protein